MNLKNAVYYETIDDAIVEIFDQYKWGLKYLGIIFSQRLLETIVYCPNNLESTFRAFCAWALWLKMNQEETIERDILEETLIQALQSGGWQPFDFQEEFLKRHSYIFKSPRELIWEKAGEILGEQERNLMIADILEDGKILFRDNLNLRSGKLDELRAYISSIIEPS